MKKSETIAVMDLGGQYAHLIATKLRSLGFYSVILDPEDNEDFSVFAGIILSGSPSLSSSDEKEGPVYRILELDIPVLGFCFGHQEIAKHYGGKVIHGMEEFGPAKLKITSESDLFYEIPEESIVFMSHGDTVTELPENFTETGISYWGESPAHRYASIENAELKRYGFQFHPEVDDSEFGEKMLENFASKVCGLSPNWKTEHYYPEKIRVIKEKTGEKTVFLLVSGGVDSTVLGQLLLDALENDKIHMIHVDTGFMRKNESQSVVEYFSKAIGDNFHFIDASDIFISELENIISPEEKRKIIGELFVKICQEEMIKFDDGNGLLAQGTIYPDTVESGGPKRAKVIKTHHNRVPMMEKMIKQGLVIEPLSDLYKKEVRDLGAFMGVPEKMIDRHPFPGPGLAVRLLSSDGSFDESIIREIENNFRRLYSGIECFCPGVKSVGVKGDLRSYELALFVQEVNDSIDFLNNIPEILKKIKGVNRIVLNKGNAVKKIRVRSSTMTRRRISLLQEIDHIVHELIIRHELISSVWQFPVAMAGIYSDDIPTELVILRPVMTVRAMTATVPLLPEIFYDDVVRAIQEVSKNIVVGLDLTTKPPGTIEWE
ncbi:MAG: glutamine-hydrolyzing GMP synthase [Deltaproteobacteria bacterium]|nr:glutamine-hydrolyzing GMP synthase [Deltaproteobacteria bacterium]